MTGDETYADEAEYAAGVMRGEEDGAEAYLSDADTIRPYDPDRTPWKDGYDDGFVAGYSLARQTHEQAIAVIESADFDQVFEILSDGSARFRPDLYAPEMTWSDGQVFLEGWKTVSNGFSGADGGNARDGIMHASELFKGALASYVAKYPGVYALVVVNDLDDDEPVGWAVVEY